MNKDAIVKACVSAETKTRAKEILKPSKLTLSEFVRLVLEQFVADHEVLGSSITINIPKKNKNDLKQN